MGLPYPNFGVGEALVDKTKLSANFAALAAGATATTANNLTATAGGGQANALPLTALRNRVTIVATAGDSVALPVSAGQTVSLISRGANSMNVFAAVADPTAVINGTIGTTAYALAAGKTANFESVGPGFWDVLLSA